jgi:chemotaxis protein methyltransferase CheR
MLDGDAGSGGTIRLSSRAFARIRDFAYRYAGIELRDGKQQLVEIRLERLLREASLRSYDDFCDQVAADASGERLALMIEALTTNHTSFLREPGHFEYLRSQVLPARVRSGRISIWSAGCSSGEEAYTLACAILANGAAMRNGWRVLGTDISRRCIAAARAGRYPAERMKALPPAWVARFFRPEPGERGHFYRIRPEVRAGIEFRRFNLMDPAPPGFRFDVVLCRNVMIYMDRAMQQRAANLLTACLEPGGYLFIGHAESFSSIAHDLTYVQPSIFRKPPAGQELKGKR